MMTSRRTAKSLRMLPLLLLPLGGLLLTGCGNKEPEPSASGYYDGPMKPKEPAGGQGSQNQSKAPGDP